MRFSASPGSESEAGPERSATRAPEAEALCSREPLRMERQGLPQREPGFQAAEME